MRIGVIHAFDDHLEDVCVEELPSELARLLFDEPVPGLDLFSGEVLEHEHALGHVGVDHFRHDQTVVVRDEPADQLGVVGLLREVQLRTEVDLQLVGERLELQELGRLGVTRQEPDGRAQEREVHVDLLDDPRPAHLDDHVTPALQERAVGLCDRGGRKRRGIDAREHVRAEIGLDHRIDLGERHGRNLGPAPRCTGPASGRAGTTGAGPA